MRWPVNAKKVERRRTKLKRRAERKIAAMRKLRDQIRSIAMELEELADDANVQTHRLELVVQAA